MTSWFKWWKQQLDSNALSAALTCDVGSTTDEPRDEGVAGRGVEFCQGDASPLLLIGVLIAGALLGCVDNMGMKKTVVFVILTILMATVTGVVDGTLYG